MTDTCPTCGGAKDEPGSVRSKLPGIRGIPVKCPDPFHDDDCGHALPEHNGCDRHTEEIERLWGTLTNETRDCPGPDSDPERAGCALQHEVYILRAEMQRMAGENAELRGRQCIIINMGDVEVTLEPKREPVVIGVELVARPGERVNLPATLVLTDE